MSQPTAFAANWQNNIPGVAYNDMYIDSAGNLVTVSGVQDMQQSIAQSLLLWVGEYDFNIQIGVPYNIILGNPNIQKGLIQLYLQTAILLCNNYLTPAQLAAYGINTTGSNKGIISIAFNFNPVNRQDNVTDTILLNNGNKINVNVTGA